MEEIRKSAKERAMAKSKIELDKDIDIAIAMAKKCGLFDLLFFIYHLHWVRLLDQFPNAQQEKKEMVMIYSNMVEESLKYIISLVVKFGHLRLPERESKKVGLINLELAQTLIKVGNYINSKYEAAPMVQLFDVEVSGERDQYLKIDMSNINSNPEAKNLFNYFLRIDEDNNIKKNSKRDKSTLIQAFKDEYSGCADLFEKEMGISVDEYAWLNEQLLDIISAQIEANRHQYVTLDNGNIDVLHERTFVNFSRAFLHDKDELFNDFDSKFHPTLNRLTFNPAAYNEHELRFHHITRQPLFIRENVVIISPELIADSVFTNTHYSLIESGDVKHDYIARQASQFLDKIARIGSAHGYIEIERERDLYDGKNCIGDIDIALKNDSGHFLLIEAKNHALPMDIYFKDVKKTKDHLQYLKNEWEKKVLRRIEHLKKHHHDYSIPKNYNYIVVSRFPEVISHFSDMLILSIQEFETWLSNSISPNSFEQFYKKYYEEPASELTQQDLETMQDDYLIFGRFGN